MSLIGGVIHKGRGIPSKVTPCKEIGRLDVVKVFFPRNVHNSFFFQGKNITNIANLIIMPCNSLINLSHLI